MDESTSDQADIPTVEAAEPVDSIPVIVDCAPESSGGTVCGIVWAAVCVALIICLWFAWRAVGFWPLCG